MVSLLKFLPNFGALTAANRNLIAPAQCLLVNYSTSSRLGRVVQKLGIAEPPRRPLNGFLRFQQENRSDLQQSAKSQRDLCALMATKWRSLSAEQKDKYNEAFNTEIVEYKKQYANYLKKLSPEQRKSIAFELKQDKENRAQAIEKKNRKNENLDEGKPKRPLSAFLLFASAKAKASHKKTSDLKNEWDQLGADQKLAIKQKAQQLLDAYGSELMKWEDRMMASGKVHLVRKSRFLVKSAEGKRPRKKSPSNK